MDTTFYAYLLVPKLETPKIVHMSMVQSWDKSKPEMGLVLGKWRGAPKGGWREGFIATSVSLISSNIKSPK